MARTLSLANVSADEALLRLALEAGAVAAWEKTDGDVAVTWYEPCHPEWVTGLEAPLRDWLDAIDGKASKVDGLGAGAVEPAMAVHRGEFQIIGGDGRTQWIEARAYRLDEATRRRWVGIVTAMTERRRCEFPAAFIHELRNPLAAMLSSAQLLRRHGQDRPDLLDSASRNIERQVKHLGRLLGEISEWSRIWRGEAEPPLEILDLRTILAQAEAMYRPLLEAQQQALSVGLPESPLYSRGASARLAETVGKLLLNAAKFTPEGGKIRLDLVAENRRASIYVRDDGVGIDPAMLDRVFDPFFQHTPPLHPGHTGLGLGLALAKHWVERLGGEITAWSAGKGQGSEFAIHLPLATVRSP